MKEESQIRTMLLQELSDVPVRGDPSPELIKKVRSHRRRILAAAGLFVPMLLLAVGFAAFDIFRPTTARDHAPPATATEPQPQVAIGTPARDADIEFVVRTGICEKGELIEGEPVLSYCMFSLRVTNRGGRPTRVRLAWQSLHVEGGVYHPVNSQMGRSFDDHFGDQAFTMPLAPGRTVPSVVFFAGFPDDADARFLELHGSEDSPGVRVAVTDCGSSKPAGTLC